LTACLLGFGLSVQAAFTREPKPTSSTVTRSGKDGYRGYLAVQGPDGVFFERRPLIFNRLFLTPLPEVKEKEISDEEAEKVMQANEDVDAKRKGDAYETVEASAGTYYYPPYYSVQRQEFDEDGAEHEREENISPDDLLFFFEKSSGKGGSEKNYYIPFEVPSDGLWQQPPPARSKATYRKD